MTIFGFVIPVWVIISVIAASFYILFTVLGKLRIRKLKQKRADDDGNFS